jgi:hypothetical protein
MDSVILISISHLYTGSRLFHKTRRWPICTISTADADNAFVLYTLLWSCLLLGVKLKTTKYQGSRRMSPTRFHEKYGPEASTLVEAITQVMETQNCLRPIDTTRVSQSGAFYYQKFLIVGMCLEFVHCQRVWELALHSFSWKRCIPISQLTLESSEIFFRCLQHGFRGMFLLYKI